MARTGGGARDFDLAKLTLKRVAGLQGALPEGDNSDSACYQVPADIADNKFTDSTALQGGKGYGGVRGPNGGVGAMGVDGPRGAPGRLPPAALCRRVACQSLTTSPVPQVML